MKSLNPPPFILLPNLSSFRPGDLLVTDSLAAPRLDYYHELGEEIQTNGPGAAGVGGYRINPPPNLNPPSKGWVGGR